MSRSILLTRSPGLSMRESVLLLYRDRSCCFASSGPILYFFAYSSGSNAPRSSRQNIYQGVSHPYRGGRCLCYSRKSVPMSYSYALFNNSATHDHVIIIEYYRLAGCDGALGVFKEDFDSPFPDRNYHGLYRF